MVHLHIAVVGGPQYDRLYERLGVFEQQTGHKVTIVFRGCHPELNDYLARTFPPPPSSLATGSNDAGVDANHLADLPPPPPSPPQPLLDLVSTHIKYAPSQAHFLLPLDETSELPPAEQAEFLEAPLQACRVHGQLLQLPRMIDSRVLFYRRDLLERAGVLMPPSEGRNDLDETVSRWTWQDLIEIGRRVKEAKIPVAADESVPNDKRREEKEEYVRGYVFPGKQSGLFGTFYELAMMMMEDPDALFDGRSGQPTMDVQVVTRVLEYLRDLVQQGVVPDNIEDYYFDEVSQAFQQGKVAIVADWPSFFGDLKKQLLEWSSRQQQQEQQTQRHLEHDFVQDEAKAKKRGDPSCPSVNAAAWAHQQPKIEVGVMRYCPGWNGTRSAYSGMHSFAIPRTCRYRAEAVELLKFLVADEQQWLEASESGSFPTKKSVLERLKRETRRRAERSSREGEEGVEREANTAATMTEEEVEHHQAQNEQGEMSQGVKHGRPSVRADLENDQKTNARVTAGGGGGGGGGGGRAAAEATATATATATAAAEATAAAAALARLEVQRLECLSATIESDMAMFPHLACYPELEDELFPMIQDAMMGRRGCREAAEAMQAKAQAIAARAEAHPLEEAR